MTSNILDWLKKPNEKAISYLEMGPWYQECFSSELTGVT